MAAEAAGIDARDKSRDLAAFCSCSPQSAPTPQHYQCHRSATGQQPGHVRLRDFTKVARNIDRLVGAGSNDMAASISWCSRPRRRWMTPRRRSRAAAGRLARKAARVHLGAPLKHLRRGERPGVTAAREGRRPNGDQRPSRRPEQPLRESQRVLGGFLLQKKAGAVGSLQCRPFLRSAPSARLEGLDARPVLRGRRQVRLSDEGSLNPVAKSPHLPRLQRRQTARAESSLHREHAQRLGAAVDRSSVQLKMCRDDAPATVRAAIGQACTASDEIHVLIAPNQRGS